eukprot:216545-Alexandrium_andersonii.AAC.1
MWRKACVAHAASATGVERAVKRGSPALAAVAEASRQRLVGRVSTCAAHAACVAATPVSSRLRLVQSLQAW